MSKKGKDHTGSSPPKPTAPPGAVAQGRGTAKGKRDEADFGDGEEKSTLIPQFDPEAFARDAHRQPDGGHRAQARTFTDEVELEAARQRTLSSAPETTQMPESMRASLLSMADARASIAPSRPVAEAWTSQDKSWDELTLEAPHSEEPPTRPSGADVVEPRTTKSGAYAEMPASGGARAASRIGSARRAAEPAVASSSGAASSANQRPTASPDLSPPPSSKAPTSKPESGPTWSRTPSTKPAQGALPAAESETILREMRDRFSLGDYTGALALAEGLLEEHPENAEVSECAENCRAVLRQMYTARIGPLDRVPMVTVARDQLRWLSIDHRAGFVLSHIDGISSLEMILDVSGMPLLDALRILCELAQQRIISFR